MLHFLLKMAEKPPYIKPPEKKSVPTTNKSAVMKLARAASIQTIHAKYRDIKDAIKARFTTKQANQPQKADERLEDPMQAFMRREQAAKASTDQSQPASTVMPSGSADTKPRPPSTTSGTGGNSKKVEVLGPVTLSVCHFGVPKSRKFNCGPPF